MIFLPASLHKAWRSPCYAKGAAASGVTDSHGRLGELATGQLRPGNYQLVAELQSWFARDGRQTLYRQAQIDFMITAEDKDHFHLPFLIAPGGWSTYRGS